MGRCFHSGLQRYYLICMFKNLLASKYVLFVWVLTIFSACTKQEIEERLVSAPPDTVMPASVYSDYINKSYILVVGREPDSTERASALSLLNAGSLNQQSRYAFLDVIFANNDYKWRQINKWRTQLLNSTDSTDVGFQISVFDVLLADTAYQAFWSVLQVERDRLEVLANIHPDYVAGTVSIRELQKVFVNNYFYDQINMGAANFVIATFQHFLSRNPTIDEQSSGVNMLNGSNAVLFLKAGSSREEFLDIFFSSNDYFEGAVRRVYNDYLLRNPGSLEMATATLKYKNTLDYESIQKDLLASDEFVGIRK